MFFASGKCFELLSLATDELALLFTGSQALPSQITDRTTEELENDDTQPSPVASSEPISREASPTPQAPSQSSNSTMASDAKRGNENSGIHVNLLKPLDNCPPHPLFTSEQLGVDRRLLVNRKRQLKMYRVWIQGKFRKLET